jgi:AGZA family xanthine/uracil permease-like MFS transporter
VGRFLDRFFRLSEHGTTPRTEVLGGLTTFVTMAYIIVVNPAILAATGIEPGPGTVATVLAAVFGCLLMGLYANRPIAVAPYMGENAFLAFGLAATISWQERLGVVFVSGVVFLALTLLGLRSWLARSISPSMKHSFAVGIGLFLMLIGLYLTGIVTSSVTGLPVGQLQVEGDARQVVAPPTPLKLGDLRDTRVLLAVGGFLVIAVLMHWKIRGAILNGMVLTAAAGYALGVGNAPSGIVALPWGPEYDLGRIAGHLDIRGVLQLGFLPVLITLVLVSFLDTLGTLVAVGSAGGMVDDKGNFQDIEKPMLVDACTCIFSGLIGTSTSGAFIESATGIREGARTGLAAVTTGVLFALSLFFLPLAEPLRDLTFAYGPALMAVGLLMLQAIVKIDFEDLTEMVPAIATITLMLFSYNIANGMTAGLILYPIFKVAAGRWREVTWGAVVLAALCAVYYVFGMPH